MPDIVLQDLYGDEQVYENVTEFSLKRKDGGTEWFIERPLDYFVLRATDYEPSGESVIATGGVGPIFGSGEINLLMTAYAPVEGVSEHVVIAMLHALGKVSTGYYYVYESLTGEALLAVTNSDGTCAGTAQPGWNILESVDGVDTLRHIDDPESVSIGLPHPYDVIDETAFYSFLSPAGQENKSVTLTENGTVSIGPEPGSRGLRSVQVTVDVEGGGAEPGGVQWREWDIVNGQCTVTAEDFRKYFTSETSAAVFSLFDASPLGLPVTVEAFRSLHSYDSNVDGAAMSFPFITFNYDSNGAVNIVGVGDQVTIIIQPDGNGSYTMRLVYVYMNGMDVTAYITASAVPQKIYAIPSPFAD